MCEWMISSSILIAVVMFLRFALKGKMSLRLQYGLWALVLVRLLLPISFGDSPMSLEHVTQKVADTEPVRFVSALSEVELPRMSYRAAYDAVAREYADKGIQIEEMPLEQYAETVEYEIMHKMNGDLSLAEVAKIIWVAGMAVLGLCFVLSNLRLRRHLQRERTLLTHHGKLPIYLSHAVDTPCLFGLFRPAIYLTEEVAEEERTRYHAVEHELTHCYHRDHIWAILRGVCLAIHWYNPLVWWAAVLSRNDAELACDEATIRRIGESERAAYGRTLLRLTCEKRTAMLTTATTMTSSGRSIKERIALLVHKPKMAVYTLVAVILVVSIAVGCTFTGANDNQKESRAELWPENAVISCARFEYAGDNSDYQLITSEVAQFNSLRQMNLLPVAGEFTEDVIYRLILNWNGIAKGQEEYTILVGAHSLSVNGQLYQPDGFDFSEILSYFDGKYRYFDTLSSETTQDDGTHDAGTTTPDDSTDEPVDEELAFVLRRLETLQADDIKMVRDSIRNDSGKDIVVDTAEMAAHINVAAKHFFHVEHSAVHTGVIKLYLSDNRSVENGDYEVINLYISLHEPIIEVSYGLEDSERNLSVHSTIGLQDVALYSYLYVLYGDNNPVDQTALAQYGEILSARAAFLVDYHNSTCAEHNLPPFTGFDITYLRLENYFTYNGYTYEIYGWDPAFWTDDPNPGRYAWPQDGTVDDQNRVYLYNFHRYFVAAWFHDDFEYEFFTDEFQYFSELENRSTIIEHFTGEQMLLREEKNTRTHTIYTKDGISIAIPTDLRYLMGSGVSYHATHDYCYGSVMNPTYYRDNHNVNDQTLFALYHTCDYMDDALGWIFSIQRYTAEEYEQYYRNSYSRQYVFAKDDTYYYCVLIPTDVQFPDPTTATIIEELRSIELNKITADMIARNGLTAYSE